MKLFSKNIILSLSLALATATMACKPSQSPIQSNGGGAPGTEDVRPGSEVTQTVQKVTVTGVDLQILNAWQTGSTKGNSFWSLSSL